MRRFARTGRTIRDRRGGPREPGHPRQETLRQVVDHTTEVRCVRDLPTSPLIRTMLTSPARGPDAQWHRPFPRSRTLPFGAAVNSHAYPCLVSCRRSTPSRPVIRTLLVGLGLRNL
jgi:hypothetical protein